MVIHRLHSDEIKQEFLGGMPKSETTDRELAEGCSFEEYSCMATWAEIGDFFFCHLETERQADILSTLNEKSLD